MPYLAPHFDPDVFVSYSHGDPQGGRAPLRDWTQALVRRLIDGLHALETEFDGLHIWMDPEIDPTAYLTDDLREKASACGVLMIVMSNRYLKSSWCGDELEWFKKQFEGRAAEGGRVFVIRAQKTDENFWPDFLRDARGHGMIGFPFHDPETGFPLGFQVREPDDNYFKQLTQLQIWLTKRLRELSKRGSRRAQQAEVSAAAEQQPTRGRRIYLYARPDVEPARVDISRALVQDGIVPLTATHASGGRSPADWQLESRERVGMAKGCDALALLRADEGERFREDLLDIGVDERKRMSDVRGAPLPCAVLDKTGEDLPIDVAPFGIERFDVNRADWRSQFRAWLDAAQSAAAVAAP
jgi:TIR domain